METYHEFKLAVEEKDGGKIYRDWPAKKKLWEKVWPDTVFARYVPDWPAKPPTYIMELVEGTYKAVVNPDYLAYQQRILELKAQFHNDLQADYPKYRIILVGKLAVGGWVKIDDPTHPQWMGHVDRCAGLDRQEVYRVLFN